MKHLASARPLVSCHAEVGESPLYDADTHTLCWVDIPTGRLWRCDLATREAAAREIGEPVGSVALIEGGGLLLAARHAILILPHWDADPVSWQQVKLEPGTQFNDGKCDARGRFFAGTAAHDPEVKGTLYRIGHDGSPKILLQDIGMSNGMDWSPDDRFFYYVDSLAGTVTRYDWDADAGVPHGPSPFIEIARGEGLPDGLTIDAEGFVWLAVWGSGQVRRYDPDGRLAHAITLSTPNITSCAFGGQDLSELYITTASVGVPQEGGAGRLAGDVFVAETTTRGQRRPMFPRLGLPAAIREGR